MNKITPTLIIHNHLFTSLSFLQRAWFGLEQSHGCTNMTIGDAHWLYNWADVGNFVWVHDRTGRTPTDPSFYGAGGA